MGLTFALHDAIELIQGLIVLLLHIDSLIRKSDGNNHTREIEQIDRGCVAVVSELVMADRSGRGDGSDDGIEFLAELFLCLAPLGEVFNLVVPFLELDVPELVHVGLLDIGLQEVFDVGDGGFARGVDVAVDVLDGGG